MPLLQIHLASVRPGRKGPLFADWLAKHAAEHGRFEVQLVDYAEVNLPMHDEPHSPATGRYEHAHTIAWSETVSAADAVVFVVPEYNSGYCASVKNAIDYLGTEWRHMPVSFLSYGMMSSGMLGVAQLKQVCNGLGMLPARASLHLSLMNQPGADGAVVADDGLRAAADGVLDELRTLTDAAAALRHA